GGQRKGGGSESQRTGAKGSRGGARRRGGAGRLPARGGGGGTPRLRSPEQGRLPDHAHGLRPRRGAHLLRGTRPRRHAARQGGPRALVRAPVQAVPGAGLRGQEGAGARVAVADGGDDRVGGPGASGRRVTLRERGHPRAALLVGQVGRTARLPRHAEGRGNVGSTGKKGDRGGLRASYPYI
ncbi:MAG: hypothetical protein AVDCRST_MAG02-2473, partial [uncultured Rubrobacteraceae bacterium]